MFILGHQYVSWASLSFVAREDPSECSCLSPAPGALVAAGLSTIQHRLWLMVGNWKDASSISKWWVTLRDNGCLLKWAWHDKPLRQVVQSHDLWGSWTENQQEISGNDLERHRQLLERIRMVAQRQSSEQMTSLFIYWALKMLKAVHRKMTSSLFYGILSFTNQTVNIQNCDSCYDQYRKKLNAMQV